MKLRRKKISLKKSNFNSNKRSKIRPNRKLIKISLMSKNSNSLKRKRYPKEITKTKYKR